MSEEQQVGAALVLIASGLGQIVQGLQVIGELLLEDDLDIWEGIDLCFNGVNRYVWIDLLYV